MEVGKSSRCVKISLPDDSVVDILTPVIEEMEKWVQDDLHKPESGGYIVGYQHKGTYNISLDAVSHPYIMDERNRIRFNIKDPRHKIFLAKARRSQSYYMGAWHTHPQDVPVPSNIDWDDWNASLQMDTTGCQYIFFIIVGIMEWRIWVGNFTDGSIKECFECQKDLDGIYLGRKMEDEK